MKDRYLVFYGRRYQGKYSLSQTGQSKFSSITEEGSKKFDELCAMSSSGRNRSNRTRRREIEGRTLTQVRVNAGIVSDSLGAHRKRKRAKPKHVPTQSDMGHDDFAEDKVNDDADFVLDLANLTQTYPQVSAATANEETIIGSDDETNCDN